MNETPCCFYRNRFHKYKRKLQSIVHLDYKSVTVNPIQKVTKIKICFYPPCSFPVTQREGQGQDEGHLQASRSACLAREMHLFSVAYFGESRQRRRPSRRQLETIVSKCGKAHILTKLCRLLSIFAMCIGLSIILSNGVSTVQLFLVNAMRIENTLLDSYFWSVFAFTSN